MSRSLIVAVSVQLLCQLYKVAYYSIKNSRWEGFRFFSAGGMPSAHSAFVTDPLNSATVAWRPAQVRLMRYQPRRVWKEALLHGDLFHQPQASLQITQAGKDL